mgnify:CR=1 FL=1|tara:strand:- start:315 stop:653 length:339 start_codon:yes stop_codon:yes gene_type:complete
MTVTWNVTNLKRTKTLGKLSDVITVVHWEASDTETVDGVNYSGNFSGTIGLESPEESGFVDFDSVTKENVIAWTKAALGSEYVASVESSIAGIIAKKKAPVTSMGVPSAWSS